MKKEADMSWKYIFCFAGNWNQFRDWMWRNGLDEELLNQNSTHVVFVDTWRKVRGYSPEIYRDCEIMTIGTFFWDGSIEMFEALIYLKERKEQLK